MRTETLSILVCPNCAGTLALERAVAETTGEIASGILACGCSEFPVLGGIPIFKRAGRVDIMKQTLDAPEIRGPELSILLDLIRAGAAEDALLLLLTPPPPAVRRALGLVELLGERAHGWLLGLLYGAWKRAARKQAPLFLGGSGLESDRSTSALDAFDYYYRRSSVSELYNHFTHRFGQPRNLTSLDLAALLAVSDGPVLDVACGFGHTLHYWRTAQPARAVVGLDRNFFELYVAKRWVAPGAEYVCSEADMKLPFRDGTFRGAFCSDAFHYFLRKALCVDELQRVVGERGLIVLARVGNALVEPREGYELDPDGYARLFSTMPRRLVADRELLRRYRDGRLPDLAAEPPAGALDGEKWISLVASRDPDVLRDHGRLDGWPHGCGRLAVNPLYRSSDEDDGGVLLAFSFPSRWYAFENGACLEYMPETIRVGRETLSAIARGERSAAVEELVRQCVVLGLPARYC
jgi:SAM-dependent methyltransferase/uncharacterized protein YbaR (Trm112 family)